MIMLIIFVIIILSVYLSVVLNTAVKENLEQGNTQTSPTEQAEALPTSQSHHVENPQSENSVDSNVHTAKHSIEALESMGKSTNSYR
jgi:hypothetical protein